jgi:hypothetical protein
MAVISKTNLVTFRPTGGPRVILSLEGDFTLTGGVQPNVNNAVVDYAGFAMFGEAIGTPGRLEFWYGASPLPEANGGNGDSATPDRFLEGVRIVEVEPLRVGVVQGETKERVTFWRLALCDVRERFAPPLGGLLSYGLVNPESVEAGETRPAEVDSLTLVQRCLDSLGVAYETLPPDLAKVKPPRDLKWFGVPAREELAKLLDHCGCVLVPHKTGTVGVRQLGVATGDDLPTVPGGREEVDVTVPSTTRRGSVVVFTSAPNPVLDTIKLIGPSPSTWQYVVLDVDKRWKPLDDPAVVVNYWGQGSTAQDAIRRKYETVGATHRDRVRSETFRTIRLNPAVYLPAIQGILRRQVKLDDKAKQVLSSIEVRAKRAQQRPDSGGWKNSTELIPCTCTTLGRAANVIRTWELLGKVEGNAEVLDLEPVFVPLAHGELEVRLTVEAAIDSGKGDGSKVPEYAAFGFTRLPDGTVQALTPEQSRAAIDKPTTDVVVISRPELRLVRDKSGTNETDNRSELQTEAKALADEYFRGANTLRVLSVQGYLEGDPSGRVSEVRISQMPPRTTFMIDRVNGMLGPRLNPAALRRGGRGDGAGGGHSQSSPLALGGTAGGTQPVTLVEPYTPPPFGLPTRFVGRIVGAEEIAPNLWEYSFEELGKTAPGVSGWSLREGGRSGKCWNLIEQSNGDNSLLMGNGVNLQNLGGTGLVIAPAPHHVHVEIFAVQVKPEGGGPVETEYWFQYENGVDGPCEPTEGEGEEEGPE